MLDDLPQRQIISTLSSLNCSVCADATAATDMVGSDMRFRRLEANRRLMKQWDALANVGQWEEYRDRALTAMKQALKLHQGLPPAQAFVSGSLTRNGICIENLVIGGIAGQPISANLYRPEPVHERMAVILIISCHHHWKTQVELLDMGQIWARAGCMVLVIDHPGYGERRQQPYGGREDYRWRYHSGMQLETVGQSLMGWMVADQQRGLDVLLAWAGADRQRVIVIGAVAGGGDVAAVLAAIDQRVTCVIPYNVGTGGRAVSPVKDEIDRPDYLSLSDFDTTRILRNSGVDGFVAWVLLAAVAPRRMIYACEFDWEADLCPAYMRLSRVYQWYATDHETFSAGLSPSALSPLPSPLTSVHGYGRGSEPPTKASHCNNVGPSHRQQLYPILQRWLGMAPPLEFQDRPPVEALNCFTPEALQKFPVRPMHAVLADLAATQVGRLRTTFSDVDQAPMRGVLRALWSQVLGNTTPATAVITRSESVTSDGVTLEKLLIGVEERIDVPALLLTYGHSAAPRPVVVGVAQDGKAVFLAQRSGEIAELLAGGIAVCLIDVRGTGETFPGGDRNWYSASVELASEERMLGGTMLGARLRDLRRMLAYLRTRSDIDGRRIALWGESFAPVNADDFVDPPMKSDNPARLAEPLGATLALLGALYEDNVRAVLARGGLVTFASLLDGPAAHVNFDMIVPWVLCTGDLPCVAAALATRPVRLECCVDGRNHLVPLDRLHREYAPALAAYSAAPRLSLSPTINSESPGWLLEALR